MEISDELLAKRSATGDRDSLEILIKRYLDQVFAFVLGFSRDKVLAQDITQETFIKVWKKIKKFDTERKFKPWLFTIAKNTALDQLKRRRQPVFSDFESTTGENILNLDLVDSALRPDQLLELEESNNWLEGIVAKLSEKYREVVVLKQDGHTFREIALELGAPLHTVKSRYRRALLILKKSIAKAE